MTIIQQTAPILETEVRCPVHVRRIASPFRGVLYSLFVYGLAVLAGISLKFKTIVVPTFRGGL